MPPRWTVEPIDQNAVVGHGVSIACQAEGFPIPTVTWKQSIGKSRLRLETYQPTVAGGSSRSEKLSSVLLKTHRAWHTFGFDLERWCDQSPYRVVFVPLSVFAPSSAFSFEFTLSFFYNVLGTISNSQIVRLRRVLCLSFILSLVISERWYFVCNYSFAWISF